MDIKKGRIDLEYPYSEDWRMGCIVVNKEPRRNVILYNNNNDRSTVSYARYLYEVFLGRYLEDGLVVDHIDNDKMNDVIENYQVLTSKENNIKSIENLKRTRLMCEFICGFCGNSFIKTKNATHFVIKTKGTDYCSRSCSARKNKKASIFVREFRS